MDIVTKNLEDFYTIAPVGPFYAPAMSRSGRWMRPLTRSWRCTFFTCLVVEEIFTLFECWLLLNIALRLQGLTLRHPERSWSHLAGSFHDSEFLIQNFVGFFINADLQPTIIFNHRPTIASPRVETPRGEPDKKAKQRKLQMNWSFDPRISLVWDLRCTENQIPTRNYNHKYSQIISQ